MAKSKAKIAVIRANADFKGGYKPNTMRAAYADRMAQFVGKPVSEYVASCEADCPHLTKKNTAEPVKGWVTFLTTENGPFVIS